MIYGLQDPVCHVDQAACWYLCHVLHYGFSSLISHLNGSGIICAGEKREEHIWTPYRTCPAGLDTMTDSLATKYKKWIEISVLFSYTFFDVLAFYYISPFININNHLAGPVYDELKCDCWVKCDSIIWNKRNPLIFNDLDLDVLPGFHRHISPIIKTKVTCI